VTELDCAHSGPDSAERLLLAGRVDQVDHIDATGILW
jgi:hypothetical protein